jgi:hypothetical protein
MTRTTIAAVLLGAGAGLIAGAPLAFAGDMPSHDDGGHHRSHHGHGGDTCSVKGGDAGAGSTVAGDSLANTIAQVPVGGANVANLTCTSILNDNLNGNSIALDVL